MSTGAVGEESPTVSGDRKLMLKLNCGAKLENVDSRRDSSSSTLFLSSRRGGRQPASPKAPAARPHLHRAALRSLSHAFLRRCAMAWLGRRVLRRCGLFANPTARGQRYAGPGRRACARRELRVRAFSRSSQAHETCLAASPWHSVALRRFDVDLKSSAVRPKLVSPGNLPGIVGTRASARVHGERNLGHVLDRADAQRRGSPGDSSKPGRLPERAFIGKNAIRSSAGSDVLHKQWLRAVFHFLSSIAIHHAYPLIGF